MTFALYEFHVVLKGALGQFTLPEQQWAAALELAWMYGWKSAGTRAPEGMDRDAWERGYTEPCGQQITPLDTWNLRVTLEIALEHIPGDEDEYGGDLEYPWAAFSGPAKQTLRRLIAFCRGPDGITIAETMRVQVE